MGRHSIFIPEIASTFNEALLLDNMLWTVQNDEARPFLFGNDLDGPRATSVRVGAWDAGRVDSPGILAGGRRLAARSRVGGRSQRGGVALGRPNRRRTEPRSMRM
jgi:hypothetical protein